MSERPGPGSGLEGAPDIMLLTMAALMVALVWLVSQAQETTLPPIDLPSAELAGLGTGAQATVHVSLESGPDGIRVWLEDRELPGGVEGLEAALRRTGATSLTLRVSQDTPWRDGLAAMSAAARLKLPISIAARR